MIIARIGYYFGRRRRTHKEEEKAKNTLQLPPQTEEEIKAETALTLKDERIEDKTAKALRTIQVNHAVTSSINTMEPIPLEDFKHHIHSMHANNNYLFVEEYISIEPNHTPTYVASRLPCNTRKNRYTNVLSYDHSRVRLTEDPRKEGSDYINANYIHGYHQPNGFIAAQGPTLATIPDMWRMVWEQATATIVMITKIEEKGKIKCHKYWPDDKGQLYGRIIVHTIKVQVVADYTQRTFSLQMNNSQENRTVTQFQYNAWPDHGVPDYPTSLLYFVRKVMATNPENSGPIVVHCSAGVGRSGAFITLFSQLLRIKSENTIDIVNFVQAMRYNRNLMVQTLPQYIFIHDALLEAIECGVTEVAAKDLQNQFSAILYSNDALADMDQQQRKTGSLTSKHHSFEVRRERGRHRRKK